MLAIALTRSHAHAREKLGKEGRFRQCATDEKWKLVSKAQNVL